MRITESRLKEIIKEELEEPRLAELLQKLLTSIDSLDVSIDYLSAAVTGQDPLSMGQMQKSLGRYYKPPKPALALKEEMGDGHSKCIAGSADKRVKAAVNAGAERILVFDPDCNLMNPEEIDATLTDLEAGVALDDLYPPEMY